MEIRCKACGLTFRPEDYNCQEDLLCPLMQIEIIETEPDETGQDEETETEQQQGKGYAAPSDTPKRIEQ